MTGTSKIQVYFRDMTAGVSHDMMYWKSPLE